MFSTERFSVWFQAFSFEYYRLRASRTKSELQAQRAAGAEEYLSEKPARLPRPRFNVRVSTGQAGDADLRRPHRATHKKPTGRPPNEQDVYLAPKVLEIMWNEWVTKTEAIQRTTDGLGKFDGWDDPESTSQRDAMRAARNSARERVYRSLARYREQIRADKEPVNFANANDLAGCALAPAEAPNRDAKLLLARYWG